MLQETKLLVQAKTKIKKYQGKHNRNNLEMQITANQNYVNLWTKGLVSGSPLGGGVLLVNEF